jgi:hypothetical protein
LGSTRQFSPMLITVSENGKATIIPVERFIDKFVRWYDTKGKVPYAGSNLSDDQLSTLGRRLAQRLPLIESEPLIFKKTKDPGLAWHLLDIDTDPDREDLNGISTGISEAEEFSLAFLKEHCPHWHEQLTRMTSRLGFLAYIGSVLDLSAKPQQYLWLYGDGQDGKSSILKVLKKIFGSTAIATDWQDRPNNFFTSRLESRRLLLVDEEPDGTCVQSDLWRRLTGADTIMIEPKGQHAYEIENNMLIIVGSNNRPSTKARKSDLRRLIISELTSFDRPKDAKFDDLLLEEIGPFLSLCQRLWREFKGKAELAPVDDEMTRTNLDEVYAPIADFVRSNFNIFASERIDAALGDPTTSKKGIPHTTLAELCQICKAEKIMYLSVMEYLKGMLRLKQIYISFSKHEKRRVIFGIVANSRTRMKHGLDSREFDQLPPELLN